MRWITVVVAALLAACTSTRPTGSADADSELPTEPTSDATSSELPTDPTPDATSDASPADTPDAEPDAASGATDAAPDVTSDAGDSEDTPHDTGVPDDAPADATATDCPAPPYGTDVGDTLADLALVDCDGNPVRLSAACDRPATYLNTFAGWCPPCRADAEDAPATYAALTAWGQGDALWLFVITEDAAGEPPTLAYCRAIRDDYDLPMTVLVDLEGALPDHLGVGSPNSWHLALARGMRVEALEKYDQGAVLEVVKDLVE